MNTILVILADGFEEIEVAAPVDILRRLGQNVIVAGVETLKVKGSHNLIYQADILLNDLDISEIDGIVIPGGPASFALRENPQIVQLVQHFNAQGKLVAALCAAPIVLAKADIIEGKKVVAFPAPPVYEFILDAKGLLDKESSIMRDGNIITGKGPGVALEFSFEIGKYFTTEEKVAALKETMCVKA